jgi:hypothetical protein
MLSLRFVLFFKHSVLCLKADWERYPYYFQLLDEIRIREEFQLRTFGTKTVGDVRHARLYMEHVRLLVAHFSSLNACLPIKFHHFWSSL